MNIDERIEALTQSVELLAAMHKDNEKRMDLLAAAMAKLGQNQAALETVTMQIGDGVNALMQVARDHEERLVVLEENV